jgi:uncharacterized protein (TIGR02266 family)
LPAPEKRPAEAVTQLDAGDVTLVASEPPPPVAPLVEVPKATAIAVGFDALNSAPPTSAEVPPQSERPDSRRSARHRVEMEVNFFSESNFYLGFTENLSEGGVFVATYCARPIGDRVEIDLVLAGEQLTVSGVVRWLRMDSCDGWPGMGVKFEGLSAESHDLIRRFVAMRDPLFFDE